MHLQKSSTTENKCNGKKDWNVQEGEELSEIKAYDVLISTITLYIAYFTQFVLSFFINVQSVVQMMCELYNNERK